MKLALYKPRPTAEVVSMTASEQLKAALRESMRLDPPPKPAAPVPASDAKGPRP